VKNKMKNRAEEKPVLETHHGNCVVKGFDSREIKGSAEQKVRLTKLANGSQQDAQLPANMKTK